MRGRPLRTFRERLDAFKYFSFISAFSDFSYSALSLTTGM